MATFRGLAPELIEPWVTRIFFKEFTMQRRFSTELFKQKTATGAFVDDFQVAGLGRFVLKPEGVPVAFSDPVQGARRRTVMLTYALGFRVTMEMREDEEHGIISQMPADLAESARDSMERLAWGLYNDGWAAATYTGVPEGDGTRRGLFATGHVPLRNTATTQSNRLNPGVALSTGGLQSALTIFETTQSEEERFVDNVASTLVVHPENRWAADTLLESQSDVDQTNPGVINTVSRNRIGVKVLRVPYITDTDAWSLFGNKHTVTDYTRKSLTRTTAMDSQSFDMMFIAHWRKNVMIGHWRGTVGSAP